MYISWGPFWWNTLIFSIGISRNWTIMHEWSALYHIPGQKPNVYFYSKFSFLCYLYLNMSYLARYNDAIILLRKLLDSFRNDRRRGYWSLRLSIDLEHVGCLDESLQVAEDGILDPWVRAGSKLALQRRVLRLGKPPRRWKTPSYSKSLKRKIAEVNSPLVALSHAFWQSNCCLRRHLKIVLGG